jgi:4-diphosphocytidyl-2C-methyl-D-erythritol kinase
MQIFFIALAVPEMNAGFAGGGEDALLMSDEFFLNIVKSLLVDVGVGSDVPFCVLA